jgi:nucleotide-binding universal stress UspA family protein
LIAERWFQPVFKPLAGVAAPCSENLAAARATLSMYRKILIANDSSPGAQRAFGVALELAKRDRASLHMVTVEELPWFPASIDEVEEEKAEAEHHLAAMVGQARVDAQAAQVAIEIHLVPGHPVQKIVGLIEGQGCDLLVVGFSGHTRLYEQIIGSTTERLVRLAPCSVLVVK